MISDVDVRAKVLACNFRGSPRQITVVVKAVLTLQYLIRDPFGTNKNETTA
ncbi:hypothetical protein ACWDA7_50270 [Streptomyces sp. NPDC001156]